jgi:hypothetical protein
VNIVVERDYDGYFEGLTKRIVSMVKSPKYTTVIVTAGPYRPNAVSVNKVRDRDDAVHLDYYSALRTGFGRLSEQDLIDIAAMLSN